MEYIYGYNSTCFSDKPHRKGLLYEPTTLVKHRQFMIHGSYYSGDPRDGRTTLDS